MDCGLGISHTSTVALNGHKFDLFLTRWKAAGMINWNYFPRSTVCPSKLLEVIEAFRTVEKLINSEENEKQESNEVLEKVAVNLLALGFDVETGKKNSQKIFVPVLFGQNGKVEKRFEADAWHKELGIVLEVEAGRAYVNNQFLKDLFQASMMHGVDYCVIAVRNIYQSGNSKDFEKVSTFIETMYASDRLSLPFKGILIIGY
jgi:hypothetical protein